MMKIKKINWLAKRNKYFAMLKEQHDAIKEEHKQLVNNCKESLEIIRKDIADANRGLIEAKRVAEHVGQEHVIPVEEQGAYTRLLAEQANASKFRKELQAMDLQRLLSNLGRKFDEEKKKLHVYFQEYMKAIKELQIKAHVHRQNHQPPPRIGTKFGMNGTLYRVVGHLEPYEKIETYFKRVTYCKTSPNSDIENMSISDWHSKAERL